MAEWAEVIDRLQGFRCYDMFVFFSVYAAVLSALVFMGVLWVGMGWDGDKDMDIKCHGDHWLWDGMFWDR